jgi:hypothetical protein
MEQDNGSAVLDGAVRVGLVAYGVVHLLVAWLAVRLAFGDNSNASSTGALEQLAKSTPGRISLYVVAAGLFALVLWQLLEALVGHRDDDGAKRWFYRAASVGKAIVYGTIGVSAVGKAVGAGSNSDTDPMTARLMSAPGGQAAVAVVGLAVLGVAVTLAYRGWTEGFAEKLDGDGNTGRDGSAYRLFGKIGYLAKGLALAMVGGLFVWAALTHDPRKSGGLDQALHTVLQQPLGSAVLVLIGIGVACFGLFCFAWARHLDR